MSEFDDTVKRMDAKLDVLIVRLKAHHAQAMAGGPVAACVAALTAMETKVDLVGAELDALDLIVKAAPGPTSEAAPEHAHDPELAPGGAEAPPEHGEHDPPPA